MSSTVRINYVVNDDQVDQATKALENLSDANEDAAKSTEDLTEASEQQDGQLKKSSKLFGSLGDQLKGFANQVSVAGKGLGDLSAGLLKSGTSTDLLTKRMRLLKIAIASTGIGALVIALGTLITFFTKTQRGSDRVNQAFAAIGATIDVLIDRVSRFGEGLFEIISGNFQVGLDLLKTTFEGIGEEIAEEAEAAFNLEKRLQELERREISLIVTREKARASIKALNKDAEDTTLSLQQRLDSANEAIATENRLQAERIAIAKERADIVREQLALGESLIEDERELAEAEAELFRIQQESDELLTTLQNKRNILADAIDKETEASQKQAEVRKELNEQELEDLEEIIETELALAEQQAERELEIEEAKQKERLRLIEEGEKAKVDSLKQTFSIATEIAGEESTAGKAFASFQAGLNIAEGITKALSAAPPPFNLVLAGITAAAGAIQLNKINSAQPPGFAEGVINLQGKGSETSDSIPAYLSRGESVMTARETRLFYPTLMAIRSGLADADMLNNAANGNPLVIDATKVVEVPTTELSWDETGFTAYQRKSNLRIEKKARRYSSR